MIILKSAAICQHDNIYKTALFFIIYIWVYLYIYYIICIISILSIEVISKHIISLTYGSMASTLDHLLST